ncbi:putative serine protease K12H4.7 [Aphelenchoides besseyi]|nr:putative serine protease K12H4.7 [Aphelenchoides besseyi]
MKSIFALFLFALHVAAWPHPLLSNLRAQQQANRKLTQLPDQYFTQVLDHFDSTIKIKWNQRYWQNDQFYRVGGPQFLHVGSNDEEVPDVVSDSDYPMVQWAKKYNARLWNLEHRFWGQSRPLPDLSVENLKYLNASQALEDISLFIQTKNQALKTNGPWVLFGAGYAGALALWHRELHPELTVGAVGSSAPMDITFDYYDFIRVSDEIFVNQSQKCADYLRDGFALLHEMMDNKEGRDEVDYVFRLKPQLSEIELTWTHVQNFYHVVAGNFLLPLQFSGVNSPPWNSVLDVASMCKVMEKPALNAVVRLTNTIQYVKEQFGEPSDSNLENNFDDVMEKFKNISYDGASSVDRAQIWQNCYEQGGVPSTTENTIFGADVPVNYYYDICRTVFGSNFTTDFIQTQMQNTIKKFGRADDYNFTSYQGTNVVIPMGSVDPYRAMRVSKANNPTVVPYLIKGTAYCADAMPINDTTDPADLKALRSLISDKIGQWISGKADKPIASVNKVEQQRSTQSNSRPRRHQSMGVTENYFMQPLDHFNPSVQFKQRYYLNDLYATSNGPVFLLIGDQADFMSYYITEGRLPLVQWAQQFGATLIGLELRFYGASQPPEADAYLQFLNTEQILEDIALFIWTMNGRMNQRKWITFGGLLGGRLSALFRANYPDMTVGAHSCSAPMKAQVDFYSYLEAIETQFKSYNPTYLKNAKNAFDFLHKKFQTIDGRLDISDVLQVYPEFEEESVDPFDVMTFYYSILRIIGRRLENLEVSQCNEFGWYKTTDTLSNLMGSGLPVNFYLKLCTEVFGLTFDRDQIEKKVERMNHEYYDNFQPTNLLLTYGSLDPWTAIELPSSNGTLGTDVLSILINGSTHCGELQLTGYNDTEDVKQTRKTIVSYLTKWLK